jgi:hypothetical protein
MSRSAYYAREIYYTPFKGLARWQHWQAWQQLLIRVPLCMPLLSRRQAERQVRWQWQIDAARNAGLNQHTVSKITGACKADYKSSAFYELEQLYNKP